MADGTSRFSFGIGGWEHEVLDSCFYSRPGLGSLEKLSHYSRFFDAVEVRPTFWDDSLTGAEAQEWGLAVAGNRNFQFLVKLHASFTHKREIRSQLTRTTRGLLQELARRDKLGGLLAQLPYAFTNTSANRFHISRLAELFRGFPLFVEFRNSSWNQPGLMDFLADTGASPVSIDLPRMRQLMPFIAETSGTSAYLRMHGRNEKGWLLNVLDARYDYLYNSKELLELKRRLDHLPPSCERVFTIFNNTTGGKAVPNALQLEVRTRGIRQRTVPAAALTAFPQLRDIAVPETQSISLFSSEEYRQAM